MLDLLFGPLGGVLAAAAGVLGLWVKARLDRRQGATDATAKRDAQDMQNAYDRERVRNEIDRNTAGADASDKLRDKWRRE